VEVKDVDVVDSDLETGRGRKRGEGWSFTFPPVGGRKKVPAEKSKA
jgi:hypothetical protein